MDQFPEKFDVRLFRIDKSKVVNGEIQLTRATLDYQSVSHTRRTTSVLQKRRTGTDLSRCEEQHVDGVLKSAEMQTPNVRRRDSRGATDLR